MPSSSNSPSTNQAQHHIVSIASSTSQSEPSLPPIMDTRVVVDPSDIQRDIEDVGQAAVRAVDRIMARGDRLSSLQKKAGRH